MTGQEQPEDAGALELSAGVTIAGWDGPDEVGETDALAIQHRELASCVRLEDAHADAYSLPPEIMAQIEESRRHPERDQPRPRRRTP